MISIYTKHNYTNKKIKFIKNTSIYEYDMKSAGMNILINKGLLSDQIIIYLKKLNKLDREVYIGKMLQNNPEWNKIMMDEFITIRKEFMEINNIEDNDVLSIKKDALFIINKKVIKPKISKRYEFKLDGVYNNYINLFNKEYYLNSNTGDYSIKGYPSNVLKIQDDYFINFILSSIIIHNTESKDTLFQHFKNFRKEFLSKELNIEYYYDMIEDGYIFKSSPNSSISLISHIPNTALALRENIVIDNNYSIFKELVSILL